MLIDYNIIVLAFIINVSKSMLQKIKPHLLEAACKLEADDHGYLYMPINNNCVEKGPFTSQISNYHQCPLRIDHAIQQTIQIMSQEDPDAQKYIFIMMDQYKQTDEYKIKKYLQNNNGCNWIFCDFDSAYQLEPLCDSLKNCRYFYLENEVNLTQTLINIYYPEEERSHLDMEFKLKYGKTPKEAEEELKEKYGKNISSAATS